MNVFSNVLCKQSKFKLVENKVKTFVHVRFSVSQCKDYDINSLLKTYYSFSPDFPIDFKMNFCKCFSILPDFITTLEEENLFEEIQPIMKRMRYEFDHWDNAIQGFRETEKLKWNQVNSEILSRMKGYAFSSSSCMPHVHVLDLDEKGHIKPHIDSTRFCGDIIAGLNLLSDAVMRLQKDNTYYCDVLLKRRAMYIMSGPARQEFTHEVLPNEKSVFKGTTIPKKRRISIILRSEPEE